MTTVEDRRYMSVAYQPPPLAGNDIAFAAAEDDAAMKTFYTIYAVLSWISMPISAYHGYKRNDSVGWALWWGLMGSIAPVITPAIAVAQGFGQPARRR